MQKLLRSIFIALFALPVVLPAKAEIRVVDFAGNEVVLAQPASRIVALAPHIVENLYSAGVGQAIVATVSFSDFPAAAKDIPRIGGASDFSLESIIAARPDLVIGWASGHSALSPMVEKLVQLGIPVYLSDPRSLEDVAEAIRDYGALGGKGESSERVAQAYLQQLHNLRDQYRSLDTVSVFYQVWHEPLQTLNGEHIVSDVISTCGGENIFAGALSLAPKVNVESIIHRNPDAIIAGGMADVRPEWLEPRKRWPQLSAVQQGHLYSIHPDLLHRHTERILLGAQQVCDKLELVRQRQQAVISNGLPAN